jgi:hypothetical protein
MTAPAPNSYAPRQQRPRSTSSPGGRLLAHQAGGVHPHGVRTTRSNHLDGLDLVVEGAAAKVNDEAEPRRVADTYESTYVRISPRLEAPDSASVTPSGAVTPWCTGSLPRQPSVSARAAVQPDSVVFVSAHRAGGISCWAGDSYRRGLLPWVGRGQLRVNGCRAVGEFLGDLISGLRVDGL